MNNGKAIMETQDSEECIYLLAAQRQLYTESKRWKAAQFGASLAIPFVITLGQVLRVIQIDAAWAVATEALIVIALTALPKAKEGRRRAAVRIQQAFDSRVYGVSFENAGFDAAQVRTEAQKYLDRCGDSKLRNWYTCVTEEMRAGEAISRCQQMNCSWSKRLTGRYCIAAIGAPIALLVVLAMLVAATRTDPFSLVFLLSIVEWVVLAAYDGIGSFKAYSKLDEDVRSYSLVSVENIRRVQSSLYDARMNDLLIPDWFYVVFRNKDEREFGFAASSLGAGATAREEGTHG